MFGWRGVDVGVPALISSRVQCASHIRQQSDVTVVTDLTCG